VVPERKPLPSSWTGLLLVGVCSCYAPDIMRETDPVEARSPASPVLVPAPASVSVPVASDPAGDPKGAGGSAPAGLGGMSVGLEAPRHPAPCRSCCELRLAIPDVLPAGCAGEPYFARLRAECVAADGTPSELSVEWRPSALPAHLTLTAAGELLGSADVESGSHELRVNAIAGGVDLPLTLQLELLERCWLFAAMAEAKGAGVASQTRIRAERLDGKGEPLWLPQDLPAAADVESFDRSGDGRLLALVVRAPAQRTLRLFRIEAGQIEELPIAHSGTHVAHAFSPDSARLAVFTDLNRDVSAPSDLRLSVVELSDPAAPLLLEEGFGAAYQTGLSWSDESTLAFIGTSPLLQILFTPQFVSVPAAGLAAAELTEVLYPLDPTNTIRWFKPLASGFYVMASSLSFVDASADVAVVHLDAQAVSPRFDFTAHAAEGRLSLHAPETDDLLAPTFTADGCDRLFAWSGDGATLLCVSAGKLVRFSRSASGLASERLNTAWSAEGAQRRIVSHSGNWVVVADREHGLFALSRGAALPIQPQLVASIDDPGWDFAISPDERQLWAQQGHRLSLAALELGKEPHFRLLSEALPAPASCVENGLPLPEQWCGASELAGNVVFRRAGRYLAFAEGSGTLTAVDLSVPERRQSLNGQLSTTCASECIQFQ
jgi:hypothetical protein